MKLMIMHQMNDKLNKEFDEDNVQHLASMIKKLFEITKNLMKIMNKFVN